ncbi:MAG: transporter substrate-binding domain-containing protein [Firmicutes bacterium]|nr:transporter substrate-binding domain-containing protein [Bacillota bacterium]MCL5039649.1 transporter substrate-binding domain-containing protein [Bacillota bacterium]
MKRGFSILLLLVLLAIVIAGCGGSTAGSNSSKTSEPAATDAVLDAIKKTGVLTVGTDATFAPFEYTENNQMVGFDIDLVREIAKLIGAKDVKFVDIDFKGLIPGLQAKQFDMIASAMYITDERKKVINFSDPYYPGGLVIMVQKDNNTIKGPEDLKGKKIAVQIGTKSVTYLQQNYPEAKLVEVEKNAEMFLELENGRVDAVVTGKPAAKLYVQKRPILKVLDKQLTVEEYGFGIRKEDTEFLKAVNSALKTLKENGTYQKLVDKWFEGK